jgi:hypothetical protein
MAIESRPHDSVITPARLWFGLLASAMAWAALGCVDILITWQVCKDPLPFGAGMAHPGVIALFVVVAITLLTLAVVAGVISYRNWRALSNEHRLLDADATERSEFMALLGVIVSVTLGMGIVWLSLPPLVIGICARAR